MGWHENRLSNPQAQTGDCALILMPIGLGIVSRVVPPDRRNGSFEVGTFGDDEIDKMQPG